MKKTEINDLLNGFGEEEISWFCRERDRLTAARKKRARILRIVLIAAVVAVLASVLTVTVFAQNKKPDAPTPAPAASESESEQTTEKTTEPASEPTSELASTVSETPTETPTLTPTETPNYDDDDYPGYIVDFRKVFYPSCFIAILQVNEISDDLIYRTGLKFPGETDSKRVNCSVIYSHGYKLESTQIGMCLETIPDLVARGAQFYFPTKELDLISPGDVVLCSVLVQNLDFNLELLCGCGTGRGFGVFKDGKLQLDQTITNSNYLSQLTDHLRLFREWIKSGHKFLFQDLIDRIPEGTVENGSSLNEVIEVFKWYEEVERVASACGYESVWDIPAVWNKWQAIINGSEYLFAVIRITDVTDEVIRKSDNRRLVDFRQVGCDVIFGHGYRQKRLADGSYSRETVGEMIANGARLYFPEEVLPDLKVNDLVICSLTAVDVEGITGLLAGDGEALKISAFTDGKLQNDLSNRHNALLSNYRYAMEMFRQWIAEGVQFVHCDLFERMPEGNLEYGTSLEKALEIFKWFEEVEAVAREERREAYRRENEEFFEQMEKEAEGLDKEEAH